MAKLKLALYWACSCGGCEIGQLQIGDKLLKLIEVADIVFWPVAIDVKYKDVEAMPDKSIDVCLFNGGIRTSEQEHMARLMRSKSKVLIAYGACAILGGIPGLANFFNREMIFNSSYIETPSTSNEKHIFPQTSFKAEEGLLTLPEFYDTVKTLAQTVDVDYFIPGCPPEERTTWLALEALIQNKLPPKGTMISHNVKAVCDDCPRKKDVKKIKKFYQPFQIIPEPEICLLEQGLLCAGIATQGGCGAPCPQANMPCTGCYGPVTGVTDQGAHFLSAVASVIDSTDSQEIDKIINDIPDPAGTFYRYSLPSSLLRRAMVK
ncbi:MAG: oxidoreductase [Chloroflexi bacterium RBG_16_48_7]|nr:MAG: oxidoreductase [Chloroflexi bacterium RBG_16_48_7]